MSLAQPPSLRRRVYKLFDGSLHSPLARVINGSLVLLIILNVAAVILGSDLNIAQQYQRAFDLFELFSVTIFSVEYLLRLWCSVEARPQSKRSNFKNRLRYMLSPMALIDLLAILPFFLAMFINIDLRTLRLLRILRILKLSHYFSGFNIFATVIQKELRSIMATILVMIFLITIAASLMYMVESQAQPQHFGSIIQSYWWAVVTMTTVGYGDVVPQTPLGKLISIFIMLLGVGFVALPAGLLAARFGEELRERKKNLDVHIVQALADGKIDSQEYKSLLQLAAKLELKPDDLKRSIKLNKKRHTPPEHGSHCPHCNKPL